jgi:hypothetical protein
MSIKIFTYLICVEYGDNNAEELEYLLTSYNKNYACKIIRIRTDRAAGQYISNLNEAFEFSGYQEGLAVAIDACKSHHQISPENISYKFIFINDTWLTGHVTVLRKNILDNLLQLDGQFINSPAFVGLKMPSNDAMKKVTGTATYISTWAFALIGRLQNLENVRFYRDVETSACFEDKCFPILPDEYKYYLNNWLQPTMILKGWYKSIPGCPSDKSVLSRKSLTIFLEHSLPRKLYAQGFCSIDIGELISWPRAFLIDFFRTIDRIHVVYLKLKLRVPNLFLNYIKKYT